MTTQDRKELLKAQSAVTGLDFIFVHPDQATLDVHFLVDPSGLDSPLIGDLDESLVGVVPVEQGDPTVSITGTSWIGPTSVENVLRITFAASGGFSPYKLAISDERIDPFYSSLEFSFKASCPVDIDCQPPCQHCAPEDDVDFPVDYMSRDFESYRTALLDFAAQRYPGWQERSEADTGTMVIELMAALGDELAYYQDRIAGEAYLETATQRGSLRSHAALVDYDVDEGRGATGWICVNALDGQQGMVPAGISTWAADDDGDQVYFSIGKGIRDTTGYQVRSDLNSVPAHIWDQSVTCLYSGSVSVDIRGALSSSLQFNDPPSDPSGRWVMVSTAPTDRSIPPRVQPVRVTRVTEITDGLLGTTTTRIEWERKHAIEHDMELESLRVCGNVVPVTAGRDAEAYFRIGYPQDPGDTTPVAVERQGRTVGAGMGNCDCEFDRCDCVESRSVNYLKSLPDTEISGLVWLGDSNSGPQPELLLSEVTAPNPSASVVSPWSYRKSFLRSSSTGPESTHFSLEDGTWGRAVGFQRLGTEIEHVDYLSGNGKTVIFGDGEFGRLPNVGAIFNARYRTGNGDAGNLPAQSLINIEAGLPFVESISNPLPISGGHEPESLEAVRSNAPRAFRVDTRSAVRPEDYAAAVEKLPWVQNSGASFRWTGSWLTASVTPDPREAFAVTTAQREELKFQLERYRQAGRPTNVKRPKYVDIDIEITVCAKPANFTDEVSEAVNASLFVSTTLNSGVAYFSPDNFTFGDPLERSTLEAHIQSIPGVLGVRRVRVRRRGYFDWRDLNELIYEVADDEVIRVENDLDHPGHGIATIIMEGGA